MPASMPPPSSASSSRNRALEHLSRRQLAMLGGYESWKDFQTASPDDVVVQSAAVRDTSVLDDAKPPALTRRTRD